MGKFSLTATSDKNLGLNHILSFFIEEENDISIYIAASVFHVFDTKRKPLRKL